MKLGYTAYWFLLFVIGFLLLNCWSPISYLHMKLAICEKMTYDYLVYSLIALFGAGLVGTYMIDRMK